MAEFNSRYLDFVSKDYHLCGTYRSQVKLINFESSRIGDEQSAEPANIFMIFLNLLMIFSDRVG